MNAQTLLDQAGAHLDSGRADLALPLLQQATALDPQNAEAHRTLALALLPLGRVDDAVAAQRRAIALRPQQAEYWGGLASMLAMHGRVDEALEAAKRTVEINPELHQAHGLLATLYLGKQDLAAAEAHYTDALRIKPDYAEAATNFGVVMTMTARQRRAIEVLRDAAIKHPTHLGVWTNLSMALNYEQEADPAETFEVHRHYGRLALSTPVSVPPPGPWPNARDPRKRLRVGLLSADFCDHSVSYFLLAILENQDPAAVEYIGYATSAKMDQMTQRLGPRFAGWRQLAGYGDERLLAQIRADQCDVLIELSGHTMGHRLVALSKRAAPVQASYCGYPNTTGVPNVDYRLVDSITDPAPSADALATERLVRLDPCFLCFTGVEHIVPEAEPPCKANGFPTFGSFNSIKKITPGVIEAWAKVLHASPRARLLIKSDGLHVKVARERVMTLLKQNGIPEVRFDLVPRTPAKADHLLAYGAVDVALDTFPYNGTTTTCEALWMGVPVVSTLGRVHAARVSASLLSAVGLPDLAAADEDAFVRTAAALAADTDRLTDLRKNLRARLKASPLGDGPAFARRFEAALRTMWTGWASTAR